MKRHPKRARPLWGRGARKPQSPIIYIYGPLFVALDGEDITGATVRESFEWPADAATMTSATKFKSAPRITFTQSKVRADLKIKVTIGSDDALLGGAYVLAVNSEGGPITGTTFLTGTVAVLPPVTAST